MKTIGITLFGLTLVLSAAGQKVVSVDQPSVTPAIKSAAFSWGDTTFDFGTIKSGMPASYDFRFTNIGMVPLVISSAKASCGCTVTAYTRDPVEKGSSGFVRATYDATQKGRFSKTVTVTANTPEGTVMLTIKGEVLD
jgi:hypothetical protein